MSDVNVKIISELIEFLRICITNADVQDCFRASKRCFTRNRKLTFVRLVLFICKLGKRTLSVELDSFFGTDLSLDHTCTVSAFSQQRKKLSPEVFRIWNEVLYRSFYHYANASQCKKWRGYRILAADGSKISLISTKTLQDHFGDHRNQRAQFCGAQAFVQYDVLNKLFVHSELAPFHTAELTMAWSAIDQLPEHSICIYDRNFSNFKTIALHSWTEVERRFVIRAKESQNVVKQFLRTDLTSQVIALHPPGQKAIKGMYEAGFKVNYNTTIKVRLVRVLLDNGITEVLFTNLWEEDGFESELFKELYNKRWGVETAFGTSKNLLQLESMSGQNVESVYQDFYATIFMTNLTALLARQADEEVSLEKVALKRKPHKWPMQTNMNKASGRVRTTVVRLILGDNPTKIITALVTYFRKHKLPKRTGRSNPRRRKNKQILTKHKTYSNYKPAA